MLWLSRRLLAEKNFATQLYAAAILENSLSYRGPNCRAGANDQHDKLHCCFFCFFVWQLDADVLMRATLDFCEICHPLDLVLVGYWIRLLPQASISCTTLCRCVGRVTIEQRAGFGWDTLLVGRACPIECRGLLMYARTHTSCLAKKSDTKHKPLELVRY